MSNRSSRSRGRDYVEERARSGTRSRSRDRHSVSSGRDTPPLRRRHRERHSSRYRDSSKQRAASRHQRDCPRENNSALEQILSRLDVIEGQIQSKSVVSRSNNPPHPTNGQPLPPPLLPLAVSIPEQGSATVGDVTTGGTTRSTLDMGEARLSLDRQQASRLLGANQRSQDDYVNQGRRQPRTFAVGDFVFVIKASQSTGKMDSGMRGPYKVVKVLQHNRYELELLAGSYGKKTQAASEHMVRWRGEWTPDTCSAFFENESLNDDGQDERDGQEECADDGDEAVEHALVSGTAVLQESLSPKPGSSGKI
ncbi:hypothetical protein HW555_012292 [Spodoptera exigua]|uniref:Uncharacterized protein n=1 Tax=Spodoptera exigua TaxID=7107 RepID=A0A835G7S0_SPOEX|nr:hypothetical protein HW555_012292 [Spodoptera exigua]